jgi:Putative peptidoglycan binding domain
VPQGCLTGLDLETMIDPPYVKAYDALLRAQGWLTLEYGSDGYVFSNPATSGGFWDSNPNGVPHLNPAAAATQYGFYGSYDLSMVRDLSLFWDTKSGPLPTPSPPPAPPVVPALRVGSTGPAITTLQTNLNQLGAHLSVDGRFGPLTKSAVIAFQASHNCVPDGIVGPETQAALVAALAGSASAPTSPSPPPPPPSPPSPATSVRDQVGPPS